MKIAMFGHKRIPSREGGVEIVVEALSSRMVELGHEVICYNRSGHHVSGAQYDGERLREHKGVKIKNVLTLNKKGLAAVTSSISAAVCCAFSRAQVVHIHAEGPAFLAWLPKLFGKRVIVTVHGLDWQRDKWKGSFAAKYILTGERMAVKYADEIIVLSRNVQRYFKETYNRDTVWIPNGVCEPKISAPDAIKEKYGLEKDGFLLFLGRLVPEKGIHCLIEAYKGLDTDKKLVIAGGGSDAAEYVAGLHQQAAGDDRIIFTDFVEGAVLEELQSNNYTFVLPSAVEGMPLSLLDAMSYGCCCVVSDIPECAEVVEDKAITFPAGDTAALRECLRELCSSPERVAGYKRNAQKFICEKYNWDDVTQRTLALYRGDKA